MSHLLKAAKLTADMIQRRDDMRRLLGVNYPDQIQQVRSILRNVRNAKGGSLAKAALEMSKEMSAAGHDPSMIIAALVEECEATA